MLKNKEHNIIESSNYKPISITYCLARPYERLAIKRPNLYLQDNLAFLDSKSHSK